MNCPSAEQLDALLNDQLTESTRSAVEDHIETCTTCQDFLERRVKVHDLLFGPIPGTEHAVNQETPFVRNQAGLRSEPTASKPVGIPGHEVLGQLGHGGMGVVHLARDLRLKRMVALKVLRGGDLATENERSRFFSESEAVARLNHPGIVQIYEAGEYEGMPYLTMEYLEGGTLADRLTGVPVLPREAAILVEALARAVHHAHERGVVHRDLKPANVLFPKGADPNAAEDTEEAWDGPNRKETETETETETNTDPDPDHDRTAFHRFPDSFVSLDLTSPPKVADFGVSKLLGATAHTVSGAVVGTPSYMAPEQADGRSKAAGPAADVYSLGAILYQLLTGRPPFVGATPAETLLQVVNADPVTPRRLVPALPRDLETIALCCLAKATSRRYASASGLADDLSRFLRGEPITQRPAGHLERFGRWARRKPSEAALVVVSALALLGFAVGGTVFTLRLADARGRAETNAATAREALAHSLDDSYAMRIALGQRELSERNTARARELLTAAPVSHRGWEWRYLSHLASGARRFGLYGHEDEITGAAYSPDGRLLATSSMDFSVRVWDAHGGAERFALRKHNAVVGGVAFAPDGRHFASVGADSTARLWDAATGEEVRAFKLGGSALTKVAFSPSGQRLAVGDADGHLWLCGLTTEYQTTSLPRHAKQVRSLAFSPDGGLLASSGEDGTVNLWDTAAGRERKTPLNQAWHVWTLAFSPDGRRLVLVVGDGTWRLVEVDSGREILRRETTTGTESHLAYSPDGRRLAVSVNPDGLVSLHDLPSGRVLSVFRSGDRVRDLVFSPDGQRLAVAGNHVVGVWDVRDGPDRLVLRGHTDSVRGLAFHPDGRRLASADFDGGIKVWDARTGHELQNWKGHDKPISALAYSPDGQWLATSSYDSTARVWDSSTGRLRHTLSGHDDKLQGLAVHPDGRRLVTCDSDETIRVWDALTGENLRVIRTDHRETIWSVVIDPDGRFLASGSADGSVKLWDPDTGEQLHSLNDHHREGFVELALSPDGRLLASADGFDQSVQFWDVRDRVFRAGLRALDSASWMVAFSPDGHSLAAGSEDGSIKIWEPRTSRELLTLTAHLKPVWRVAFSPDGRRLASSGMDRTVQVWDARPGPELLHQCGASEFVNSVAYHPNGRWLAFAVDRNSTTLRKSPTSPTTDVFVWDLPARRRIHVVTSPLYLVRVAFSDDGRVLYAGDGVYGGRMAWDMGTGKPIAVPGAPPTFPHQTIARHPTGGPTAVCMGGSVWLMEIDPSDEELEERRAWSRVDVAWQTAQATEAEQVGDWFAAAFHLGWALSVRPDDDSLRRRHDAALAELATARIHTPARP